MRPTELTGLYRHYKGTLYELVEIGLHTETEEKLVIYKDVENPSKVWVRPYDMFFEDITVDGKTVPRFRKVGK